MDTEAETRQRLADAEARAARLTAALARVQGERDELLRKLLENEGASSSRFVGAR